MIAARRRAGPAPAAMRLRHAAEWMRRFTIVSRSPAGCRRKSKETAMPRPIHFEIQAENPERAIAFYRALFGWEFKQWGTASPTGSSRPAKRARPASTAASCRARPAPRRHAARQRVRLHRRRRRRRRVRQARSRARRRGSRCRRCRSRRSAGSPTPRTPKATCSG